MHAPGPCVRHPISSSTTLQSVMPPRLTEVTKLGQVAGQGRTLSSNRAPTLLSSVLLGPDAALALGLDLMSPRGQPLSACGSATSWVWPERAEAGGTGGENASVT